jgi:hypothetical protein
MAHFAKIENGIVTQVIVAEPDFFDSFIDSSPGEWIQTSYNTRGGIHYQQTENGIIESEDQSKSLRKNFACKGYTYDKELDVFIPPKPFHSWNLNTSTCFWEPPTPKPSDENDYTWNEETQSWDQVT